MGILFGLMVMWATFDRIWVKDTTADLMDSFVANMRSIARFDRNTTLTGLSAFINRVRGERSVINENFDRIRNLADSLVFEFGRHWKRGMMLRDQIREWRPQLRTYLLLKVALLQFRMDAPDRNVDATAEENIRTSEELLSALADLKDRQKGNQIADMARQTDETIARLQDAWSLHQKTGQTAETQPVRFSRSMLDVALSLARDMRAVPGESSIPTE